MSPRTAAIPRAPLFVCEPFGPRLGAEAVASALTSGFGEGGVNDPDVLLLDAQEPSEELEALLRDHGFDVRMRAARAVVLAVAALRESTLAGSAAFEIATRARQSGVPCYAVTAADELDRFDLRILDLQAVLRARGSRSLRAAGVRLAGLI